LKNEGAYVLTMQFIPVTGRLLAKAFGVSATESGESLPAAVGELPPKNPKNKFIEMNAKYLGATACHHLKC
jgi:hypothetical protein